MKLYDMIESGKCKQVGYFETFKALVFVFSKSLVFWMIVFWAMAGSLVLHPIILLYPATHICTTGLYYFSFYRGILQMEEQVSAIKSE